MSSVRRRASDLPFVVEGRYLAARSDAKVVPYEPVARFKTEYFAKLFIASVSLENAENAEIDRLDYRLKKVNQIIKVGS